jgi:hypothetical protein
VSPWLAPDVARLDRRDQNAAIIERLDLTGEFWRDVGGSETPATERLPRTPTAGAQRVSGSSAFVERIVGRRPQVKFDSPASSHSRQIQSPALASRALSAAGTIVTPQAGQIGGRSSSTPEV